MSARMLAVLQAIVMTVAVVCAVVSTALVFLIIVACASGVGGACAAL